MSDTLASLRRKIDGAVKLKSVVRTMKALAASSIGQYETAVRALGDYERTVELGLTAYFRQTGPLKALPPPPRAQTITGAIVFGSDQGLVGQFNDVMADFVKQALDKLPGEKKIWVVGERLHARLADAGLPLVGLYAVPNSVSAITPLVGRIQIEIEARGTHDEHQSVLVFHNRPQSGTQYQPVCQRLLPLDATWQHAVAALPWPTSSLPETLGTNDEVLRAFIREYLFILLFKACAESLASENASRLAAMQRAEQNIDTLSVQLSRTFYRLRQSSIDEELFDVIAGFNALAPEAR
jgi:F-type H+-transporting ATPase subunit gamma